LGGVKQGRDFGPSYGRVELNNVRLKKGQIYPASVLFTETPCCDGDVLQNTVSFSGPILVKRDNEQQWHAAPYSINFTYTMPNAPVSTI
jgi:hypothetical protein